MNIGLALQLLLSLLTQAKEISALINKARQEGRDLTDAELDTARNLDDVARANLEAAIQAKSGAGN